MRLYHCNIFLVWLLSIIRKIWATFGALRYSLSRIRELAICTKIAMYDNVLILNKAIGLRIEERKLIIIIMG